MFRPLRRFNWLHANRKGEKRMDLKEGLEKKLKAAELYKSQGLYAEAKEAYDTAVKLIERHPQIKNRETLLAAMRQKISDLAQTSEKVEAAPATPEMAPQVQTLIKNLFTRSDKEDPDETALEGAITLAKFGQVERAIFELNNLLEKDSVRVAAAKNILRCHQFLSGSQKAEEAFTQWQTNSLFSESELALIRLFLENHITQSGRVVTEKILMPGNTTEVLDIGSMVITLDSGPLQGEPIELDVRLQAGNVVSVIIESKEKSILDNLNVGFRLKNILFNSTVAIFRGDGIISAKALIASGPKKGDYHLDIKMEAS